MMIWKFDLETEDQQWINMPRGAEILTVQVQQGKPKLWAIVNPQEPLERRPFCVVGTGHPFERSAKRYIGSYQLSGGVFVFHVFEGVR